MKIAGSNTIPFPVDQVWDALLDPAVLVRTLPGCERLVATDEHRYAMTVTAGVAAIRGTYDGTCALSDLVEHESLTMRLQGAGAPGTVDATVAVRFEPGERRDHRRAGTPTPSSAAWSAASASGCSARSRPGWRGSSSATSATRCRARRSSAPPSGRACRGHRPPASASSPPRRGRPAAATTSSGASRSAPGLVLLGVVAGGIFGRRRS